MTSWLFELFPAAPGWLSWAAPLAAAVLVLALAAWAVGRLRKSVWLSGIGPQAVVALGGVAVSVHGLWGFATGTAGLMPVLAVAFIAVFDAAEMTLLVMMYRAADPEVGWTPELRLMHRTAWLLVSFSAAMNAVHAPNWWARPVLAAIPGLAAWLIELQLRSKLHHKRPDEDETGGRPGPVRLVVLLWQHAWASLFALLGLNARTSSSSVARAALAQRAAHRVYRLRLALETGPISGSSRRARHRLRRLRGRAQKALDRADVATDTGQSLALVRRLAALTRADEVARLNYADTPAVLALIEELAITPAAQRLESSALAERADAARQEAEAAQQRADAARKEAEAARQRAEDALDAARLELESARDEHTALLEQRQGVDGAVEAARQAEQAARKRADDLIAAAQQEADRIRATVEGEQQRLKRLTTDTDASQRAYSETQTALRQVRDQIEEAAALRDRLLGDVAEHASGDPDPVFKSEAKQAGWQLYLSQVTTGNGAEPSAGELAERCSVDPGNARNWLRDFRAARAAQLTAHQPRALTGVNGTDRS
ncbi:hypothetical protein VT50_0220860 [Streptomyces antioxidans]|uniref:DUF2637 domain-containing protein n=1 Tax=Streptomyces antioxidans TaxID=1507734 RepID=A0A1V4D2Q4_9ACTN|nr:hypothetical protein [Streptomyces antioxidans]OPF77871.1 hypothetical protein VT50_0220860 [Streptomyces antioxidans]